MGRQALEGVKVADFSWGIAGPLVAKFLGDHGATVVHIESRTRYDVQRPSAPYKDGVPGLNRSFYFANYNNNKYGVSLNLKHPRGPEIARRIVSWADVVNENFTPGTMEDLGLGYEDLKKIKPDIIVCSASPQGQSGPRARQPALGLQLTGLAGFYNITGWPDRDPALPFSAYTDILAPRLAVTAVIAALDHRRRTGRGQYLDISQYEASLSFQSPLILDCAVNGRVASRMGNSSPDAAPHGAYRCRGDDRWCAIAVFTDEDWEAFCHAIGDPSWVRDPRFASLERRKEHEDELDRLVQDWTIHHTPDEAMERMQSSGVAAGTVKTCQELGEDPQLAYRRQFHELEHPEIGAYKCDGPACLLSRTPAELRTAAPCLGEHTEYVCTEILGMPDEEFIQLLNEGVFE